MCLSSLRKTLFSVYFHFASFWSSLQICSLFRSVVATVAVCIVNGSHSFSVSGTAAWNSLPTAMRDIVITFLFLWLSYNWTVLQGPLYKLSMFVIALPLERANVNFRTGLNWTCGKNKRRIMETATYNSYWPTYVSRAKNSAIHRATDLKRSCRVLKAASTAASAAAIDPLSLKCLQSQQTLEHWRQTCPASHRQRLQILDTADPPLDILTTDPLQVILPHVTREVARSSSSSNNLRCSRRMSTTDRRPWESTSGQCRQRLAFKTNREARSAVFPVGSTSE